MGFNPQYKTKNWVLTTFLLSVLIICVLCFFFVGEFDLFDLNWIVPVNGFIWSGKITATNLPKLQLKYPSFDWTNITIGKTYGFLAKESILSFNTIYLLLGLFVLILMTFVLLKSFKIVNYDALIFCLTFYFGYLVFTFACLIPYWNREQALLRSVLIGLVTIISLTITFFIINGFFLSSVAHSKYAYNFFRDIINEEKTYAPMQKNLKEMIKKQQDEKRYIKVTKK